MLLITLSDSRNNSSVDPPVKPPDDGRLVKLAALIAGKTAGNLASGIVPDVKFVALKFVRSTGKLVKLAPLIAGNAPVKFAAVKDVRLAPLPVKDVAVTPPVTVVPVDVISSLVLP